MDAVTKTIFGGQMIRVESIETWGFRHAIRGMRNPMNSWTKSDSVGDSVGKADLELMKRLFKGGTEHRKYLRQIFVCMDITAPLYWWKEFDTYKVGTTANSCSTMHKIADHSFTRKDFSCEHLDDDSLEFLDWMISVLNRNRSNYLETKDKRYWWNMIQLLPSSFNQKRTVTMNYENVYNIIRQRSGHKLDEWNRFVGILLNLPYIREIGDISPEKTDFSESVGNC